MKVGMSFGRCVRDIVKRKVDISDVLVIITRTKLENIEQLYITVSDYMDRKDYLKGLDVELCYTVARQLWDTHKLHQPRVLGAGIYD